MYYIVVYENVIYAHIGQTIFQHAKVTLLLFGCRRRIYRNMCAERPGLHITHIRIYMVQMLRLKLISVNLA
jgi:hypothetical protein